MIRVLHVIGAMGAGGAETLLMNIYRSMDRSKLQFDFVVHTDRPEFYDKEIRMLGGKIYRTKRFNILNYFSYKRWWDQFFAGHPEYLIVHGHINSSAAIYLGSAKRHGCYTVVHSHATKNTEFSLRRVMFAFFTFPLRYMADFYFACSEQAGLDRYGKKVIHSNHFMILKNGIQTNLFSWKPEIRKKVRECLEISDSKLVIGHVGRFTYAKNHKFLLQIFAQIKKMVPDSELWLIGGAGELEEKIKASVNASKFAKDVRLIGITGKVYEYLQGMDVFVFPSVFEGLGMALVEAQAAGLPCVVSEAVQDEADIGADLVTRLSLADSPVVWAEHILNMRTMKHRRQDDFVKRAGFDITDSTHIMEDFYNRHQSGKCAEKNTKVW